jgi:hypothetical protein
MGRAKEGKQKGGQTIQVDITVGKILGAIHHDLVGGARRKSIVLRPVDFVSEKSSWPG